MLPLPALRAAAASLLVGMATTLLSLGTVGSADAATSTAVAPMRVMTYNIRAGVSLAAFRSAVAAAKPLADVVGLQEINSHDKAKALLADDGWGYYRPAELSQNPVIWRRDVFDFVSARGAKIAEARDLGAEGGLRRASYATVVHLRVRSTGALVSFVNLHLLNGTVQGGVPRPDKPNSFALYAEQVAGAASLLRAEQADPANAAVYALGDLNIGYKADARVQDPRMPYRAFTPLGLRAMWQSSTYLTTSYGTLGTALLDQVWTNQAPSSTRIVTSNKISDHYPAVAAYSPPAARAGYAAPTGSAGFAAVPVSSSESWSNGRAPYLDFDLVGDLRYGYAHVVLDREASTAVEGKDFTLDTTGWQDESDGRRRISLRVLKDGLSERDETVVLRLVDPVNAVLAGTTTLTAVIRANRT